MYGSRIVSGLAVVFGGMAAVFVALAVAYNPVFLGVAAVFGAAAYFVWYHASGRFARRLYQGVESQAQAEGAGAGPREEWVPPRDGQSAREAAGRQRRASARNRRRGPGRGNARADGARAGVPPVRPAVWTPPCAGSGVNVHALSPLVRSSAARPSPPA